MGMSEEEACIKLNGLSSTLRSEMEEKLRRNYHERGDWEKTPVGGLSRRIIEELFELVEELAPFDKSLQTMTLGELEDYITKVDDETVDIAITCVFIRDIIRKKVSEEKQRRSNLKEETWEGH
jgi:NTP pyrophosphatase (non-canonical NTP hydrolase)